MHTWYIACIRGMSGPADPSFHPLTNIHQHKAAIWRFETSASSWDLEGTELEEVRRAIALEVLEESFTRPRRLCRELVSVSTPPFVVSISNDDFTLVCPVLVTIQGTL